MVGAVGDGLATLLVSAFGWAAWVIGMELGLVTLRIFTGRRAILGPATLASAFVVLLIGCALTHLALSGELGIGPDNLAGGRLGEIIGEVLRALFGTVGAFVVGVTTLLVTLVLRTPVSVISSMRRAMTSTKAGAARAKESAGAIAEAWREAREVEARERAEEEERSAPKIVDTLDRELEVDEVDALLDANPESDEPDTLDSDLNEASVVAPNNAQKPAKKRRSKKANVEPAVDPEDAILLDDASNDEDEDAPVSIKLEEPVVSTPKKRTPKKVKAKAEPEDEDEGPVIVPPKEDLIRPASEPPPLPKKSSSTAISKVVPPSLDLLESNTGGRVRIDPQLLRENAKRLVEKLESYGVKGRVDEIHPGPVVTMYEFEPKSGIKISKVTGLENDLALALAAQKVRIVAPIPGKARIGIELPNDDRQTVYIREILEDERWQKTKGALPIALGKDIAGKPVYADLAKMPHLLVAGATGAGKSVGLNVMLASLLYKKSPEEVRMLMIDPKVVELAVFDDIPHMLLPVVTDMKKAAVALKWAVDEMERRYQLFADAGARNIGTYNARVDRVANGDLEASKLLSRKARARIQKENPEKLEEDPERLPYIVVVVDEFADLMMVAAKEVEACIARLAQKARAAGIHVILATQRPSVDVITGMIKANFPCRMAFKVSQREDSKTILGRVGAQNLLGRGDMLMIPPGSSDLKRVHCAFISEEEVGAICDSLREQATPEYDESILEPKGEDGLPGGSSDDPLYDKAIAVVANAGYCSISHLQRQLSVGYNKAAKLVDRLEADGIVGPASKKAGGRREVLVNPI